MSRASAAQQYILDLLSEATDGIFNAKTTVIGLVPSEKILAEDLPHVMTYLPQASSGSSDSLDETGEFTFILQITTDYGTPRDELEDVLSSLGTTLQVDSTMRGLVRSVFVSEGQIFERATEDERQLATATITVNFASGPADDFVDVIDFKNGIDLFGTTAGSPGFRQAVPNYPPGLEFGKAGSVGISEFFFQDTNTNPSAFPMDLSNIKVLRWLVHLNREFADLIAGVTVRLGQDGLTTNYRDYAPFSARHGWQEFAFELANPFSTVGTPPNLSNTQGIALTFLDFSASATTTNGGLSARFGYHPRDRGFGSLGNHPGF